MWRKKIVSTKKRNINLDLIRVVAIFTVLSVHFFLQTGFYDEIVVGKRMFLMGTMRTLFMICVPLFLLLTGFLMNKKVASRKYYGGLKKTYMMYVLASIACLIHLSISRNQSFGIIESIKMILNFSAASYSWYIEMYIGLFLLIPFLNLLYNGLKSKRQKIGLVVTMFSLTVLPSVVNIWGISREIHSIFMPGGSANWVKIIPSYWGALWPLTYYFIGAYIREYDIKIRKRDNFILLVISLILFGIFNYMRSYQTTYEMSDYNSFQGIQPTILAVLVFLLILHMNLENISNILKSIITKISELSLGMYLVSSIFDTLIYPKLNARILEMPKRMEWYIVIVPLVFICSLVLSGILDYISRFIFYCSGQITYILKEYKEKLNKQKK